MGRAQGATAVASGSASRAQAKADRLILAAQLHADDREALATWARGFAWPEGAELKAPDSFHVTVLYCKRGGQDPEAREWLSSHTGDFELAPAGIEVFTATNPDKPAPVVLRFTSPQLDVLADQVFAQAQARGLDPQRHDTRFNAHVTLGFATAAPTGASALPPPLATAGLVLWD